MWFPHIACHGEERLFLDPGLYSVTWNVSHAVDPDSILSCLRFLVEVFFFRVFPHPKDKCREILGSKVPEHSLVFITPFTSAVFSMTLCNLNVVLSRRRPGVELITRLEKPPCLCVVKKVRLWSRVKNPIPIRHWFIRPGRNVSRK